MRVLTLGDSWTFGEGSTDPSTMSWPAQMSKKYGVEVVNLGRCGSSNYRAARIGVEELCQNPNYDYIIFPLAPANRFEVLVTGKWHQIWPANSTGVLDKIYAANWHPFNDVQHTIMMAFYFIMSVKQFNIPLLMTGLSLKPSSFQSELSWVLNYNNDYDFNRVGISNEITANISTIDLDRKLRALKSIHMRNLGEQPEYLKDVVEHYYSLPVTQSKYNYHANPATHPDNAGYTALCDYFASKIGIV